MVAAAILAGGRGTRMGSDTPKQYLELNNEPILIHSVRAFSAHERVDRICVVVPQAFCAETEQLLQHFLGKNSGIDVIAGGENRSLSLLHAARFFAQSCPPDTVFITHDAVRPFVTKRMIDENIDFCILHGAVGTVVPAVDTILMSEDGLFISHVPPRKNAFHAQTPQTFLLGKMTRLLESATAEQHAAFTDGCSVFLQAGLPVCMVQGENYNIKITYADDLTRAEEIRKKFFN
ncbi:MAG: 2-C-methyl-D-erythritol 4-phosphate cytidylyltransferase [Clostridia bacterium]|nr:2-C-methyl-D-erythritol 4-phosphate cytidylyltransferase [Clostridia bacterium]